MHTEPAFPYKIDSEKAYEEVSFGMHLRDYFAAAALKGIMSDPGMRPGNLDEFEHMAVRMYQVADAMMKARQET